MGILAAVPASISAACQTVTCACSVASCCFQTNGGISNSAARLMYISMLGLSTILAAILKNYGHDWHGSLGGAYRLSIGCEDNNKEPGYDYSVFGASANAHCSGDAAVNRIGLALASFFTVMMILGALANGLFKGFWGFKLFGYGLAMLGCFFIPEDVFSNGVYLGIARTASAMFLVLQVLILIDFGYQWNEDWVAKAFEGSSTDDEDPADKNWLIAILASALGLYIASVVGIVLLFVFFGDSCAISQAFISISLVLIVGATLLTLFRNQVVGMDGAILPSGVVSIYIVYLTWSALQSNPDEDCKSSEGSPSATMGILFMALSLMWTSFRASQGTENLMRGDEEAPLMASSQPVVSSFTTSDPNSQVTADQDAAESAGPEENNTLFFVILIVSSLYMSMVLTDWGEDSNAEDPGHASMWAKIISAWIACLLYVWTLVAPAVCHGFREFD